ncbi:hypothetical protein SLE2022_041670 [Rubroshorea leprosula]
MAHHSRSKSFPSRPHPFTSEVDEHLSRLASSESASTSSSTLCQKLNGLQDLHDSIEKLLQLPLNQQALSSELNQKYVDELLDGSVRLFDVCTTAKDSLLQTKECIQELQSVLRRRRGTEITHEVKKYLASRKAVKKAVLKALKNLKNKQNKYSETGAIINLLQEAQAVTLNVMESLLHFVSGPEAGSKTSRLSVVSKLFRNKKVGCEEEHENEIANAESKLLSIISGKTNIEIENAQNQLQQADSCIQNLEEGLESIYRQLIKARVTILNILNH